MSHYPFFPNRKIHLLDGIWDFTLLEDIESPEILDIRSVKYTNRLAVPGVFDSSPLSLGKRGTGVYRLKLDVTPDTEGVLHFGGLGLWAQVYVDGEKLYTCQLPYSGFKVEVPASKSKSRELVVVVDNRFNFDRTPLLEQFFDFYAYGGIYRSVEWHELPDGGYWDRSEIKVVDLCRGIIFITARFFGVIDDIEFKIDDILVTPISTELKQNCISAVLQVPSPSIWSIDEPFLHILQLSARNDTLVERFGLRTIETANGQVKINGKSIKLKGFCRHEAHPQYGPALPFNQLVQDLQLFKELGCNFVRGSHYPQDQRFLDLCDELGFVVFEEALGWGQKDDKYSEKEFCRLQETQVRLMIQNSYNHPSVIMWGFLNEGGSHSGKLKPLYDHLINTIRQEDASRAVTYASNEPFRDLSFDKCDIICVNTYPGWYSTDTAVARPLDEIVPRLDSLAEELVRLNLEDKPLIISEIGAGAIYGWRDSFANRWSEQYQEEYLETACKHILESDRFAGVALWQFCDCRTYANMETLFRPRGFNNKGIVDEYRRPKMAYYKIKMLFNDI